MPNDVYIRLTRGLGLRDRRTGTNPVVDGVALRLLKAQYGLKHAPMFWNKEISSFMESQGFTRAGCESSLYYRYDVSTKKITLCVLEVDDICCTGNNDELLEQLRISLGQKYGDMRTGTDISWEPLSSFLGIRIIYDRVKRVLTMDVEQKIIDMFKSHPEIDKIPTHWTPLPTKGSKPSTPSATVQRYVRVHYASIVGAFIYIAISCRPDLAHGVGILARHMHGPTATAVDNCIHLCGYLKNPAVQRMKLEYCVQDNRVKAHIAQQHGDRTGALHAYSGPLNGVDDCPLAVYSDATLSGPFEDQCKATSGLVIFHLFMLIAWMSKLQPFTVASTHNAELLALALAADECMWLRRTIDEL